MSGECNICGEMGCVEANHGFDPDYGCKLCEEHIREHLETVKALAGANDEIDRLRALLLQCLTDCEFWDSSKPGNGMHLRDAVEAVFTPPNAQDQRTP